MSRFEKRDSKRKAKKASLILRCKERSEDRNRFLASCWLMVEPPCTTSLARAFSKSARAVPMKSTPKCSKKRRSSVASVALMRWSGISSRGTASLCRMPRWPISVPWRSRNFTANLPVLILFSSNSLMAGMARMNSTTKPPAPMVSASPSASLASRFHPVSRKRAKKLEKAFQRSCADCQPCASEESIQASMPSQSISRLRGPCLKNQSCKASPRLRLFFLRDDLPRPKARASRPGAGLRRRRPSNVQTTTAAGRNARGNAPGCAWCPILVARGRLPIREFQLDAAVAAQDLVGIAVLQRLELAVAGGNQALGRDAAVDEVFHHRGGARARQLPVGGKLRAGDGACVGVAVDLQSPVDLLGDGTFQLDDGGGELVDGGKLLRGHGGLAGGEQHLGLEHESVADDANVLAVPQELAQA